MGHRLSPTDISDRHMAMELAEQMKTTSHRFRLIMYRDGFRKGWTEIPICSMAERGGQMPQFQKEMVRVMFALRNQILDALNTASNALMELATNGIEDADAPPAEQKALSEDGEA